MTTVGALRVELELTDDAFTTRIIRAGNVLRQFEQQASRTVLPARQLEGSFDRIGNAAVRLGLSFAVAQQAVMSAYAVFGSWATSIAQTNREIERMTLLMRGLSTATTDLGRSVEAMTAVRQVMQTAERAPFAMNALADAMTKLRSSGIDNVNQMFQGLVDSVAAFGGSDVQLGRAAIAIQQMAGKGVISLEELRQQLGEAMPTAIRVMARSMNVTVEELTSKIATGTVQAGSALRNFAREMELTYGGAAAARMQTFDGQMAVLQSRFTQLQLIAGGRDGETGGNLPGSFMDNLTKAVQKLNDAMQSSEMQGFAARVGASLAEAVSFFQRAVEWTARYGRELRTLIELMAAFWAANRAAAIASAAWGSYALAVSRATVALRELAVAQGAASTAQAAGGAMSTLGGSFSAAAGAVGRFGAALTVVRAALMPFLVPAAIVSGVMLFISVLDRIKPAADRAAEALHRVRLGDNSEDTTNQARQELTQLQQHLDALTKLHQDIEDVRAGRSGSLNLRGRSVAGTLGLDGVTAPGADQGSWSQNWLSRSTLQTQAWAQRFSEAVVQSREQAQRVVEQQRDILDGAIARHAAQQAGVYARSIVALAEEAFRPIQQEYVQAVAEFENKLREAARVSLQTGDRGQYDQVVADRNAAAQRSYDSRIAVLERFIQRSREALANDTALQAQERRNHEAAIEELRKRVEELQRARAEVEGARLETGGARTAETIQRQAQALINNATLRTRELESQIQTGEGAVGKMSERLRQLVEQMRAASGLTLSPTLIRQALDAADALERVERQARATTEAIQAQTSIGQAVSRTESEFQRLANVIANPRMAEAQRSFTEFQRRMNEELGRVAAGYGMMSQEFEEAANRIFRAVEGQRLNTVIQEVGVLVRAADAARLQNLSPNDRLAEEILQRTALIDLLKQQLEAALAAAMATVAAGAAGAAEAAEQVATIQATLAALQQAQTDFTNAATRRAAVGNARAGAAEENQVTRLTARLAEMRAEIGTGTGEYAKLLAQLQRTGQINTTAGQQMLGLARQLDDLAINADRARAAWGALDSIVREGAQARGIAVENLFQLGQGGLVEPRQVTQAIGRIRGAVAELRDLRADPAEIIRREEAANQAMAGIRARYAAQQTLQYADQARELRASLADSLSERHDHMVNVLTMERQQFENTARLAHLTDDERRLALDTYADYHALRMRQIAQETENALERTMREWGRLSDNTFEVMASGVDRFADAFVEMATTGKASFADLTKALLADLAKIQLRAAASGIFKLISGAVGGGGGTTPTIGTGPNTFMGYAGSWHTGGVPGVDRAIAQLPRFHTGGLAADELFAVLQRGEGVFTEGQMAAIGRMNHSYTAVEAGMAQLVRALPAAVAPPSYDVAPSAGRNSGSVPPVTINLTNQSGQQLNAMAGTPYMDMDGMIVDVVIRNASRPGPLRDLMRGA